MSKISVFLVAYFVVTRNGQDKPYWLDMLRKKGCMVDAEDDAVYSDTMPRKPRGGDISLKQLPDLDACIRSVGKGERLVVPSFGHFINETIWREIAAKLVAKAAAVQQAENGDCLGMAGPDAIEVGAAMLKAALKRQRGRALTPARLKAGIKGGRKKQRLIGDKLDRALAMVVDQSLTWQEIADAVGMGSKITLQRRIKEVTGTYDRERAMDEAAKGNWPPKRKITR